MKVLRIIGAALFWFVVCGPTYTFYPAADADDGYLRKIDGTIGGACEGASAGVVNANTFFVGEWWTGAVWHVDQGFVRWRITGIGGGETITDAQMSLYIVSKGSAALIGLRPCVIDDFAPLSSGDWDANGIDLDAITYADINVGAYETWDVTSYVTTDDTLAIIVLTVGQCDGTDPTTDDRIRIRAGEWPDFTQDPRLVIMTTSAARRQPAVAAPRGVGDAGNYFMGGKGCPQQ